MLRLGLCQTTDGVGIVGFICVFVICDVEFRVIGGRHLSVIFGISMLNLSLSKLFSLLILLLFYLFVRQVSIIMLLILLLFLLLSLLLFDGFLFRTNRVIPCIVSVVFSVVLQ